MHERVENEIGAKTLQKRDHQLRGVSAVRCQNEERDTHHETDEHLKIDFLLCGKTQVALLGHFRKEENLFSSVRQSRGGCLAPRSDNAQRLLHAVDDPVSEAFSPRSRFPLVHAFTAVLAASVYSLSRFRWRCNCRLFECRQLD